MSKINTLKKNLDFARVFKKGKWANGNYIVIYYMPNKIKKKRLGITTNKKTRTSVERHRIKRVIREVYKNNECKIKKSYDIVIYCKVPVANFKYKDIEKDFDYILRKENLCDC